MDFIFQFIIILSFYFLVIGIIDYFISKNLNPSIKAINYSKNKYFGFKSTLIIDDKSDNLSVKLTINKKNYNELNF